MKKVILSMMAAAAALLMSSCVKEAQLSNVEGDEVAVTFGLDLVNAQSTRAIGDGTTADYLVYAVFNEAGERITSIAQVAKQTSFPAKETVVLAKGQTYKIAFWAQNSACKAYTVSDDMNVTVDYAGVNNDETRDAFFKTETFEVTRNTTIDVTLTRPFAQLNAGVTTADWEAAVASGINVLESSVVVDEIPNELNLLTGVAEGAVEVKYALSAIPTETLVVKNVEGEPVEYKWLSMGYLLANEKEIHDVSFTFHPESGNDIVINEGLNNVPVQRNWRTNIIGQLLTGTIDFNISIDPIFSGEYNYPEYEEIADGVGYDAATKTYIISNENGLVWVSDQSNGKARAAADVKNPGNFEGYTVKLAEDLDLAGIKWNPIGAVNTFMGDFDGANHTVSNLSVKVTGETSAGLFATARGTVKNVKLANVSVEGQWKTGAVVGDGLCTVVENCHVDGGKVVSTPNSANDNGNHAGGIVGYLSAEPNASVVGCSVSNLTVSAYRDVAAVVGTTNGDSANMKVEGNEVANVVVVADQTVAYCEEGKAPNAGEIVGRNRTETDLSNNKVNEVTVQALAQNAEQIVEIATAEELRAIATLINNGKEVAGTKLVLTADIDLSDKVWEPINLWKSETATLTELDGAGHKISRMTVKGAGKLGFIGSYASTAVLTVKNLTFENPVVESTGSNVGTVVGYTYGNVTLDNVKVTGANISTTAEKGIRLGGLVGLYPADAVSPLVLKGCVVENSAITGYHNLAGLVGSTMGAKASFTDCQSNNNSFYPGAANEAAWQNFDANGYAEGKAEKVNCTTEGNRRVEVVTGGNDEVASAIESGADELRLAEGTYTVPASAKGQEVTFVGTGNPEETVIDCSANAGNGNFNGSDVTFENLTIKSDGATYNGFQHVKGATYKNCIIENQLTLYNDGEEPLVFENCTFNVTGDSYNFWSWGSSAVFENCTFNCKGKAALVYGYGESTVTFNNCTFNDNGGIDGKAAIETGDDYSAKYNININGCTVNGFDVTTPKKELGGDDLGTKVWGNKDRMTRDNLNVFVDGTEVY